MEASSPARPERFLRAPIYTRTIQKSAGGNDNFFRAVKITNFDPALLLIVPFSSRGLSTMACPDVEILLIFNHCFHRQAVELFIALHPGRMNGRPFGSIEHA